jgi:16S rRNA (uracil1498-N3)-methyltransferase
MREDRFFIDTKIEKGKLGISEKEIFHQLKDVLRKETGDRIILFNGSGIEAEAKIKKFLKNKVEVEILKIERPEREPKIFVSLFCSILKKSNFELVVQKATEIGVGEIVPILSKNTVKAGLNFKRLEKIGREAAEQSKRVTLPKIEKILTFEEAIEKAKNFDLKILFDISGEKFPSLKGKVERVAIFIGPEGGWDKSEIELVKKENFEILNLGKLNLRSETAATVSSFLVIYLLSRNQINF